MRTAHERNRDANKARALHEAEHKPVLLSIAASWCDSCREMDRTSYADPIIATLILSVLFFEVNVGMGAFMAAVVLVLLRAGDDGEAVKRMPWRVIVMVCGVTVLIALLEKAQGIDLLVSLVTKVANGKTVTGVIAFLTGIISVYSSTSGVVLPAFLPMVPGLAQQLGADPVGIASSMNVGGHLVDVSPLSTIGALCLAGAPIEDARALFNKLLAWGLSMCVVGAILCYLVF